MDERVLQFRLGVVVVTALAILSIFVVFFLGKGTFFQPTYTLYITFKEAPGVTPDTPIRKNGILIGRVKNVELIEGRNGGALITARIDAKRKIARNEVCRISAGNLVLGDAVLQFVPSGDDSADTTPLSNGDYIDGLVTTDPLTVLVSVAEQIPEAMRDIQLAGREVKNVASNINTIVGNNEEQMERILQSTERAIVRFDKAMGNLNDLVGDPELKSKLKKSLEDLPEMFADARETLAATRSTMASFERVGKRAEANLENIEGITGPLREKAPEMIASVERTTKNIDELTEQALRLTEALNNREGTASKLIYDPELYQRLNRAAGNIEEVTRKVKPLIDDARVAADKVARDPFQFGIRGAFNRSPAGSGVKFGAASQQRIHIPVEEEWTP